MKKVSQLQRFQLASCLTLPLAVTVVVNANIASANAATPSRQNAIRVVNCDQKVQSRKRGVCANRLEPADFQSLAPGVSWYYNWNFNTKDVAPPGVRMEFLPMVWGDNATALTGLERYLAAGNKPRKILAINEPNLKDQAFIPPLQAAVLYKKVKAIADKYKIPVSGPQMSLGSATDASITAYDPIEKKDTTYTFMVPYLKAFQFYADAAKTDVSTTAFHSYGDIHELRWAVDLMSKTFNKPTWVTEYAQWNAPNPAAALTYLVQSTDFLERSAAVEGYAWFKERANDNANISLLQSAAGKLTALGEAYVAMPVHDADLYYRIPGRLQAENYVALDKMEIWPTDDSDGFTHMATTDAGGLINLNLQVHKAGKYTVRLRVAQAAGRVDILQGTKTLASVGAAPGKDKWQTVKAAVRLAAGPQKISVRCTSKNQAINWIEFAR